MTDDEGPSKHDDCDDLAWAKPSVDVALAQAAVGEVISWEQHRARNKARLAALKDSGRHEQDVRMIKGLSHLTFIVRDLDRMEALLTTVLGARKVYDSGDETFSLSRERFFTAAGLWLAIMEGEPLASRSYNHVAFKIDDADYDELLSRVRSLGLEVREGRPRVDGEGRSIYFYDDDDHLFELHTGTLRDRLKRYAREE